MSISLAVHMEAYSDVRAVMPVITACHTLHNFKRGAMDLQYSAVLGAAMAVLKGSGLVKGTRFSYIGC